MYELAGLLRRSGEAAAAAEGPAAAAEGQTQARGQLLSVISDEALTVPQAARRLGVTRQGVQRVANDLMGAGLAEFQSNPDHRTSPLLALTGNGRAVLGGITESAVVVNDRLAMSLGSDALQATRDGIRRLISELKM